MFSFHIIYQGLSTKRTGSTRSLTGRSCAPPTSSLRMTGQMLGYCHLPWYYFERTPFMSRGHTNSNCKIRAAARACADKNGPINAMHARCKYAMHIFKLGMSSALSVPTVTFTKLFLAHLQSISGYLTDCLQRCCNVHVQGFSCCISLRLSMV